MRFDDSTQSERRTKERRCISCQSKFQNVTAHNCERADGEKLQD